MSPDASHQVWEMSFEDFQDGHLEGHLRCQNRTILANLNLYVARCLPSSLGSIRITVWEMWFEEFQDGRRWYWNRTNSAILNLHVTPMPPTQCLNPTYRLVADVVWRSWISEHNNFTNSESLRCSDAAQQVTAQSDLQFGRRCGLNDMAAILDVGMEWL